MNITQSITLDLMQTGAFLTVCAKQGDNDSRFLRVTVTNSGMVYTPPEGATACFRCLKPDGCSCDNPAVINEDGTVTVELTEQVLAVPGTVLADLCFLMADGRVLSTLSFRIWVEPAPLGKQILSENELLVLNDLIRKAGGYYAPVVEQATENTVTFRFVPNINSLPVPETVTVTLPEGPPGDKGDPGTGVTILGSYDTEAALKAAHPVGNPGDSYLVAGNLYVWSETKSAWENVGNIQGPVGKPGVSGVYVGSDNPPNDATVWVNPTGEPTSTEDWEFDLDDGTTDSKTVVVLNSDTATANGQLGILKVKQADGTWQEIPAIVGPQGPKGDTGPTGPQGSKGDTGATGPQGPAYTLTDSDKNTIAAAVKASLTTEIFKFTLEDGSTVTKAVYVG